MLTTLIRCHVIHYLLGFVILLPIGEVFAQERITDQVSITQVNDRLLGITTGEGVARLPLSAGEEVLMMKSRGINGFTQTSLRLLGFSGPLQRWVQQRIDVSEHIVGAHVTPQLILVQGNEPSVWLSRSTGPMEGA